MIITGDDSASIHSLQHFLSQHFEMKYLGTLNYFLGLKVTLSSDEYYIFQTKYASDLLSKADITDNKLVSTPLEYNANLTPLDGDLYLMLLAIVNISHAVGMVSKFMDAHCSVHYVAILWILRYVKGTLYHGLHYSFRSSLKLHAYSDADWWRSKRQDVVSHSSTEAEYRALADTTYELI
nr:uncharacterized protein LOC112031965 [Quercus suber]